MGMLKHHIGSGAKARIFGLVILSGLLLGSWLRVRAYVVEPQTLWLDEAYWAMKTLTKAAYRAQIRPIGFMQVTQWLLSLFGPSAAVYRFLPFAASFASLWLMPYLTARLLRSRWAAAIAVVLFAVHPVAIEMSAEFKHYGSEIGVFVILLAAYLHHRSTRTTRSCILLLALAWGGFLFALTAIFLYPALFSFLAFEAFRRRKWMRLIGISSGAVITIATILSVYFMTWQGIPQGKAERKWGYWYDAFYVRGPRNHYETRVTWTAAKYFDMAAMPGVGRSGWNPSAVSDRAVRELASLDWLFWAALHVLGLGYLVTHKRRWDLLMLWSPLLCVLLFNGLGRWPGGAFRANSFYVPYSILVCGLGIESIVGGSRRYGRWLAPVLCAAALLPLLHFRICWQKKELWTQSGQFVEALQLLERKAFAGKAPRGGTSKPKTILLDNHSCKPWDYYLRYDESAALPGRAELRTRFKRSCYRTTAKLQRALSKLAASRRSREVWILLTDPRKFEGLQTTARKKCGKADVFSIDGGTHLVLRCSGRGQETLAGRKTERRRRPRPQAATP